MTRLTLFLILIWPFCIRAQTVQDALRFSSFDPAGTARSLGVNGTMGALGADFSVINTNPAGLAWYRRGEFTITPGFSFPKAESRLLYGDFNESQRESRQQFNIGSLGYVAFSDPMGPDWRSFNIALGITQLQNFNRRIYFEGDSPGSVVDRFLEIANSGEGLNNLESAMAYDAAAIYDLNDDGFYEHDFELAPNALIRRKQTINTSGALNEMTLAAGANYKDIVMIGASIGIPFLNYAEEKNYDEEDRNQEIPFFDNLQLFERLATTGVGINARLGVIVRPIQALRLGVAVNTPTRFVLSDTYFSSLTYNYTESGSARTSSGQTPDGSFNYALLSPWRFSGQAAFIAGKAGFVSLEAEYVNYSRARFRYRDFPVDEADVNSRISNQLQSVLNLRLGAEASYDIFRLRAGIGLHPTAVVAEDQLPISLSTGAGIRVKGFFTDLGYRFSRRPDISYSPYLTTQAPQQLVSSRVTNHQLLLTLGFRF
jgi:hypothetical protein